MDNLIGLESDSQRINFHVESENDHFPIRKIISGLFFAESDHFPIQHPSIEAFPAKFHYQRIFKAGNLLACLHPSLSKLPARCLETP